MGFWQYFRDTLALPLIRRQGALAGIAEGGAGALDSARDHVLWLRDQYAPGKCEAEHVANFAVARGIKRHRLETDTQFRARVVRAYAWQLLGGKQSGLPQILAHYGYTAKVESLREEDPARWAEFRVSLDVPEGLAAEDYELLNWIINDQKPARSRLAAISVPASDTADVATGGLAAVGMRIAARIRADVAFEDAPVRSGGLALIGTSILAALPSPTISASAMPEYAVGVARILRPITVGA